jgi:hypothetical protein
MGAEPCCFSHRQAHFEDFLNPLRRGSNHIDCFHPHFLSPPFREFKKPPQSRDRKGAVRWTRRTKTQIFSNTPLDFETNYWLSTLGKRDSEGY